MAISKQQINVPAQLDLPSPGTSYSVSYFNQFNGMLRTFLFKLTGVLSILFGPRGGKYLNTPYGAVQRDTSLTFAVANTAYLVSCATEDYLNGMSLDPSDGIHVSQSGIYNYQFSIQMSNTDTSIHTAIVWLKKNGVDVTGTGSKFDVPNKHGSSDGYLLAACNFYVDLNDGDHVELWAAVTNTSVYFNAYNAQTTPFVCPSIPSVVATLSFVSNKVV